MTNKDGKNAPRIEIVVRPTPGGGYGVFADGLLVKQHSTEAKALEHALRLKDFEDDSSPLKAIT